MAGHVASLGAVRARVRRDRRSGCGARRAAWPAGRPRRCRLPPARRRGLPRPAPLGRSVPAGVAPAAGPLALALAGTDGPEGDGGLREKPVSGEGEERRVWVGAELEDRGVVPPEEVGDDRRGAVASPDPKHPGRVAVQVA